MTTSTDKRAHNIRVFEEILALLNTVEADEGHNVLVPRHVPFGPNPMWLNMTRNDFTHGLNELNRWQGMEAPNGQQ